MGLAAKLRRAPGRLATGAFILNSGLGKLNGTEDTAKMIHGMASGAYPQLAGIESTRFLKLLAVGELTLGGMLLTPVVPAAVAGAGLTGFAGALVGMWWRTPGMHEPGQPASDPGRNRDRQGRVDAGHRRRSRPRRDPLPRRLTPTTDPAKSLAWCRRSAG